MMMRSPKLRKKLEESSKLERKMLEMMTIDIEHRKPMKIHSQPSDKEETKCHPLIQFTVVPRSVVMDFVTAVLWWRIT
jgi:hypothetical protein